MATHKNETPAGTGAISRFNNVASGRANSNTLSNGFTLPDRFETAGRVRSALQFVPANDRELWTRMLMAIKSEFGEDGLDIAESWSQSADSYNERDFRDVWKSIKPGGAVSIKSLFYQAKANGWRDDQPYVKPTPEQLAKRQQAAAQVAALEESQRTARHLAAAQTATKIWDAGKPAQGDHDYLKRKGVQPLTMLRELPATELAKIAGYEPQSNGEPLTGRVLIAPIKLNGQLASLEFIDGGGRKSALKGGRKAGGYAPLQPLPDGDGAGLTLLVAEGLATALSARESTGFATFAALSSGNLVSVAKQLRAQYPAAEIVMLADVNKETGQPDPHAIQAAQAIGGRLAVPDFGDNREPGDTDFNDMAQRFGLDKVRMTIEPAAKIKPANAWPAPEPLMAKIEPEPYPLEALPERILAAVNEVRAFVQAPAAMVATCALAAVSLAIQAHVDVKRAERLTGPVGLFSLVIADSGERKSTCDSLFSEPIRKYEQESTELAKPLVRKYEAAFQSWEAKKNGLKDKMRQLSKEGSSTKAVESALVELEQAKPEPPRVPRMIYADATPEALCWSLRKWPTGGVLSSEAGSVLGSHGMNPDSAMRNLAMLNQLWSAETLTIDRKTSESYSLRGARLTMALQVQEPTLRNFLIKSGALARGSGFLARFLIAWPESTQGTRPFSEPPANWPHLENFYQRIDKLLDKPFSIQGDGGLDPLMLTLEPDAKVAWVAFHDNIESELAQGGELHDVRDVASKIADNAARLAALFQVFEQGFGSVSLDAMARACRIAAWHLSESRRFFGELAQPEELADAAKLDSWLISEARASQAQPVATRKAQQFSPIRDKTRLEAALVVLGDLDRIRRCKIGKSNLITVNPGLWSARL